MPDSLVETKFLVPRPRATAVERARLDDLVQRGTTATLTLVAAPAGFGKTTLLGGWVATARGDQRTAWVSLDERDLSFCSAECLRRFSANPERYT